MMYQRASNEELRENGFDPEWIAENPDREGPYAAIGIKTTCPCCYGDARGWTVVNLATATGISQDWTHDEAQIEALEKENELNGTWTEGYQAGQRGNNQ